jgi:hypothetical protein
MEDDDEPPSKHGLVPYPLNIPSDRLNNQGSYSAWIIPLRGIPPWKSASSAILVEESQIFENDRHSKQILWSANMVKEFWQHLLNLRSLKTFGTLGLALAHTYGPSLETRRARYLSNIDHMKIYHLNDMSSFLRQELNTWSYMQRSTGKIRLVLQERFLALVNEVSELVLIA